MDYKSNMDYKKDIIDYAIFNYSTIALKMIYLFYDNIMRPNMYKVNLKIYFTEEELKTLIKLFNKEFDNYFYNGTIHVLTNEKIHGMNLVKEQNNTYTCIYRRLINIYKCLYSDIITDEDINVLNILLTEHKDNFFTNYNDYNTNVLEQRKYIELILEEHCFINEV
jgi:hypothetical protein